MDLGEMVEFFCWNHVKFGLIVFGRPKSFVLVFKGEPQET